MFPSYIIVQTTGEVDSFTLAALKKVPDFYHFLNSNTDIVALGDRIVVIEGPLKGIEGSIIKVDKHKSIPLKNIYTKLH